MSTLKNKSCKTWNISIHLHNRQAFEPFLCHLQNRVSIDQWASLCTKEMPLVTKSKEVLLCRWIMRRGKKISNMTRWLFMINMFLQKGECKISVIQCHYCGFSNLYRWSQSNNVSPKPNASVKPPLPVKPLWPIATGSYHHLFSHWKNSAQ